MDKVQRRERTEQPGLQEEQQRDERARVVLDAPRRQQAERNNERREQHHQQAHAVDAEEVLNANGWNPFVAFDELKLAGSGVEVRPQQRYQPERERVEEQAQTSRERALFRVEPGNDRSANQRRQNEQGQQIIHLHPQMKKSAPIVRPSAMTRR